MGQKDYSNTTYQYQTHKEDPEWFGGNRFGFFLTANVISFGSDLLMSYANANLSANCSPDIGIV
jgi:hypothetical protein